MKPYQDPVALSLAMMRVSGYAVAMQMHCAAVFARSMVEFANAHAAATARSGPEPEPRTAPTHATASGTPRLVASNEAPAKARRQPSAPPPMPATGTDES